MDKEINVLDLARLILRRWWVVALATIVFATGTYVFSQFFLVKQYSSTGTLYVQTTSSSDKPLDLSSVYLSQQLVNTYTEILSSNFFANLVKEKLAAEGINFSAGMIKRSLHISAKEDSEIMTLNVVTGSPRDAQKILQTVLDNAPEGIQKIVRSGVVSKIDDASYSESHISPRITVNTAMGGVIGAIVSILLMYLISYFDVKIKHEDDLSKKYNLPVLGIIPDLDES